MKSLSNIPKTRSIGKNITIVFLSVALVLGGVMVGYDSLEYSLSPLYVSKILARKMVLDGIGAVVSLLGHDEVPTVTGPGASHRRVMAKNDDRQVLGSLISTGLPGRSFSLLTYDNPPISYSSYKFGYQSVSDVNLAQLRGFVGADTRQADPGDDFKQVVNIADWVNAQWKHGTSGNFDPTYFDARTVLTQGKHGATFWCHVSAMTLIQVAASFGFQGRLVSLSSNGYVSEHAVTEFWSNYYKKWFMMDPDFNVWYSKGGIPMDVLEIHNASLEGKTNDLEVNKGKHRPIMELENRIPRLTDYYRYFEIDMRNDWMSHHYFPGHPARSDKNSLFWKDGRLPALFHFKTEIADRNNLYWDLNRTHLSFHKGDAGNSVLLSLETYTPDFSHFDVQVDQNRASDVRTDQIVWALHDGLNRLKVCSVNVSGQRGIPCNLAVQVTPVILPNKTKAPKLTWAH